MNSGFIQVSNAEVPRGASGQALSQWLVQVQQASKNRAYTGTFVVSAGAQMSSARIWHVCDGTQQLERVDTLSGPPRTTLRRNDEVVTFVPEARQMLVERRDSWGLFPTLLQATASTLDDFYALNLEKGTERVAGLEADRAELKPKDSLRFGYRVWTEKKTGLVLKLQTVDDKGRVLEQVAFSELNLNAPLSVEQVASWMKARKGYEVHRVSSGRPASAETSGWRLRQPVPGFAATAFHVRADAGVDGSGAAASAEIASGSARAGESRRSPSWQWVFSDGLAAVSLFIEPFDVRQHGAEIQWDTGATHSLSQRVRGHWLTAVGEVPYATLRQFAERLDRSP